MIESQGPESSIGDVCKIHVNSVKNGHSIILAEVVGFKEEIVILMPYTNIQRNFHRLFSRRNRNSPLEVKVGPELIGKVLDSMGNPIDGTVLPKGSNDGWNGTRSTKSFNKTTYR